MLFNLLPNTFIFLSNHFELCRQLIDVLKDQSILFFLLQKGLGDLLQVIYTALLLDLLEALLDSLHAFLVKLSDFDFLLVEVDQIADAKLDNGLSVRSFGRWLCHSVFHVLFH